MNSYVNINMFSVGVRAMGMYADGEHDMDMCSVDMRSMDMHCAHVYSADVTGICILKRGFSTAVNKNIL
jgi:hypothetical protein